MNKDRLFTEYMKLSKIDKKIIYEYLTQKRKVVLDKQIYKLEEEQRQNTIDFFAKAFTSFGITSEGFKNIEEAALTFAIIQSHGYIDPYREEAHYERRIYNFNIAKQNMLAQLEYLLERENPLYFIQSINEAGVEKYTTPIKGIYNELKKLKFISTEAKRKLLENKSSFFKNIYGNFGTGQIRMSKLIQSIVKYIEFYSIESEKNIEPDTKGYIALKDLTLKYKNGEVSNKEFREILLLLYNSDKDLLCLDEETDNHNSIKVKTTALTIHLSDNFIELGDELLRVNCPVEHYPLGYYFNNPTLQEYIDFEKEIFEKYEKELTTQHIENIEQHYDMLFTLPNTEEELKELNESQQNSFGISYEDT